MNPPTSARSEPAVTHSKDNTLLPIKPQGRKMKRNCNEKAAYEGKLFNDYYHSQWKNVSQVINHTRTKKYGEGGCQFGPNASNLASTLGASITIDANIS